MTKLDFEYPNNLVKIAVSIGTPEQEKTGKSDTELKAMLTEGVATLQGKLIMLEAMKMVMAGNKKLAKRAERQFEKICKELGLEDHLKRGKKNA